MCVCVCGFRILRSEVVSTAMPVTVLAVLVSLCRYAVAGDDIDWDQALGASKNTGIISIAR